jgi:hypothetical protein
MRSPRFALLGLVLLLSTGCIQLALAIGRPAQRAAIYDRIIDEAVGDAETKQDCPRWVAGLNSIRDKLPTMDGKSPTPYGNAIKEAYHDCTLVAVEDLKVGTGSELDRGKQALERFDLVLSLPLEGIPIDDRSMQTVTKDYARIPVRPGVVALRKLRAETAIEVERLETARAEKVAREAKRLEAAKTAEEKEWFLASLAAWTALDPMDDVTKGAKDAALARLSAPARKQLAVTVSLAPATTDGAPEPLVAELRRTPSLTSMPTIELVNPGAAAVVQAGLSLGAVRKDSKKQSVSFKHVYVSGSEMVPNPRIEELTKKIAEDEKQAKWLDSLVGDYEKNAEMHRAAAERRRKELGKLKPMVSRDIKSVHEYEGVQTVYTATALVGVVMSGAWSPSPAKKSGTAKIEKVTIAYPGNPSVRLDPRNDPAPSAAELDEMLNREALRLFANGILPAAKQVAGEFDSKAAASKDPLEKLHYALIRALRSGADADRKSADELGMAQLEATTDTAALLRVLAGEAASGKASIGSP